MMYQNWLRFSQLLSAGEATSLILYNGKEGESINQLRKRLLLQKVAKAASFVKPERLPPTKSSLRYHSFRVFLQIMKWIGDESLNPEDWGWLNVNSKLLPKPTMAYYKHTASHYAF